MAKFEITDPTFSLEIEGATAPSLFDVTMKTVLDYLITLHAVIPMVVYEVNRIGSGDVWQVAATAQDGRHYSTTATLAEDKWLYALSSFPEGSRREVNAFLEFIEQLSFVLKSHEIESVEMTWVV